MKNASILLLFALLSISCRRETTLLQPDLAVGANGANLLEHPSESAKVIRTLPPGEKIADLQEVSRRISPILLNDTLVETPWLRVVSKKGDVGWVYAWLVEPTGRNRSAWLLEKQCTAWFGKDLANQIGTWRARLLNDTAAQHLDALYIEALNLRPLAEEALETRAEPMEPSRQPGFYWLSEAFPGFVVQQRPTGPVPNLWVDFKWWRSQSTLTPGREDDRFFSAAYDIFPLDSVESPYPVWKMPLPDGGAASKLGAGIHHLLLRRFNKTDFGETLFHIQLERWQDSIEQDLYKNNLYWMPKGKIIAELKEIIADSNLTYSISPSLQFRLDLLAHPDSTGLRVNLRAGM